MQIRPNRGEKDGPFNTPLSLLPSSSFLLSSCTLFPLPKSLRQKAKTRRPPLPILSLSRCSLSPVAATTPWNSNVVLESEVIKGRALSKPRFPVLTGAWSETRLLLVSSLIARIIPGGLDLSRGGEDKVGRVILCEGRGERGLEQNKENFRNEKPRVKGFRALPSESRYRIAVKIITVSEHPALKAFHRRYMERERERFDASVKCGCRWRGRDNSRDLSTTFALFPSFIFHFEHFDRPSSRLRFDSDNRSTVCNVAYF